MFRIHSAISLELIALVSGVALLLFIKNQNKLKNAWPVFVAWIVIILSALSIICSIYYTFKFWNERPFYRHRNMMKNINMTEKKEDLKKEKQESSLINY